MLADLSLPKLIFNSYNKKSLLKWMSDWLHKKNKPSNSRNNRQLPAKILWKARFINIVWSNNLSRLIGLGQHSIHKIKINQWNVCSILEQIFRLNNFYLRFLLFIKKSYFEIELENLFRSLVIGSIFLPPDHFTQNVRAFYFLKSPS